MRYDARQILDMLQNDFLGYEPFTDDDIDIFLSCVSDNFNFEGGYSYASGATKFVIIPEKEDFVIKIPFSGTYRYGSFGEFCCGLEVDRPWDYCANEEIRFEEARLEGLEDCFAETVLIGFVNNYPIYVQEKCETYDDRWSRECEDDNFHSNMEIKTTRDLCKGQTAGINLDWLTDFRLCFGNEMLYKFIDFITSEDMDDDLRDENIGYLNEVPVLIDYSSYMEQY